MVTLNEFPPTPAIPSARVTRGIASGTLDDKTRTSILQKISWLLGQTPPGIAASPIPALTTKEDYLTSFMNRPRVSNGTKMNIAPYSAAGDYLHASLFLPKGEEENTLTDGGRKIPVVIFLHGFSNTGFDASLSPLFEKILDKGVAVLAMDLIGYGTRIEEGTRFYQRYPHWSKLGKMVTDTRSAVDALRSLDFIDPENIYVSGFALGGTVSLVAAAMDERIAGAAVSCAFSPWKGERDNDIEGVKAWSHLYGLMPRLGFFIEDPSRIPVDFPEILSAIAPRPLMIIAPTLDRHANNLKIAQSVEYLNGIYQTSKYPERLQVETPAEFNGLSHMQQTEIAEWLERKTNTQN